MKQLLDFLQELKSNNNREWFIEHKPLYDLIEVKFRHMAEELIQGLCAQDDSLGKLEVKDCTYRIYRDIRFSSDKSPYKTWKGVFVVFGGKKSGFPGYYLHFEPGNCFLCAGLHMPSKQVLESFREEVIDSYSNIEQAIRKASKKGFSLCVKGSLRKLPRGFENTSSEMSDLLRLRDEVLLERPLSMEEISSKDFLSHVLELFGCTQDFVRILNRSTAYVLLPDDV
ncbi:MAG: DUF2461 domain-containing protein [Alistipes sp.]|nr:DUF2461 domain-containing protein [Candidatus Alistipes equi]